MLTTNTFILRNCCFQLYISIFIFIRRNIEKFRQTKIWTTPQTIESQLAIYKKTTIVTRAVSSVWIVLWLNNLVDLIDVCELRANIPLVKAIEIILRWLEELPLASKNIVLNINVVIFQKKKMLWLINVLLNVLLCQSYAYAFRLKTLHIVFPCLQLQASLKPINRIVTSSYAGMRVIQQRSDSFNFLKYKITAKRNLTC